MENNLNKKIWANLASLLIIGSCSIYPEVSASTQQPKDFMHSKKVESYNELNKENLKQCIIKAYKGLLKDLRVFFGCLSRPDKHQLLALSLQYILNHPEIGASPIISTAYLDKYAKLDESRLIERLVESVEKEEKIVKFLESRKSDLQNLLERDRAIEEPEYPKFSTELETIRVIQIYSLERGCVKDYIEKVYPRIEGRLDLSRELLKLKDYIVKYNSIK